MKIFINFGSPKNFCLEILKNVKYYLNKILQKSKIFFHKIKKISTGLKNFCLEILKNEKYWLNKILQKSKIFSKKIKKIFIGSKYFSPDLLKNS